MRETENFTKFIREKVFFRNLVEVDDKTNIVIHTIHFRIALSIFENKNHSIDDFLSILKTKIKKLSYFKNQIIKSSEDTWDISEKSIFLNCKIKLTCEEFDVVSFYNLSYECEKLEDDNIFLNEIKEIRKNKFLDGIKS